MYTRLMTKKDAMFLWIARNRNVSFGPLGQADFI
jgi:hypothetical protein